MATSKVFDLDATIASEHQAALASIRTVKVKLFGEEFRVVTDVNTYAAVMSDAEASGEGVLKQMHALIHEGDLARFKTTLAGQRGLSAEVLGKIVNGLFEAAAERPTTSSSGSGRGAVRKTSKSGSVANARSSAQHAKT